ncbi:MAG: hypothetical protein LUC37_02735 [Prevotella sp.]|nr:hypothetical protein [Prevotella sp.]
MTDGLIYVAIINGNPLAFLDDNQALAWALDEYSQYLANNTVLPLVDLETLYRDCKNDLIVHRSFTTNGFSAYIRMVPLILS